MSGTPGRFGRLARPGCIDCLVLLCILIALIAAGTLAVLTRRNISITFPGNPSDADGVMIGMTFVIGGLVGLTELISRYRDNPWRAARSWPGVLFIAFNGVAAILALFLMQHFDLGQAMKLGNDKVAEALVAGTGAMVVIRSKLFTIRQPGGTDVAFGPAFVVDTFLAVVNREVDRRLAAARNHRVATWARGLRHHPFADAVPFLLGALSAFQDMDAADAKRLRDEFRALLDDAQFARYPDEAKYYLAGFDILTVFGDTAAESMFAELQAFLTDSAAPTG